MLVNGIPLKESSCHPFPNNFYNYTFAIDIMDDILKAKAKFTPDL